MLGWTGQQVSPNAPCDPCGRRLDGVPDKMGVAGGRLNLGVPQEPAEHREAFGDGRGAGRKEWRM